MPASTRSDHDTTHKGLVDYLVEELSHALSSRELRIRGDAGVHAMATHAETLVRSREPGSSRVRVSDVEIGSTPGTAVEVLCPDQPFLVDTFRMTLRRLGLGDMLWCSARLAIEREDDGSVTSTGRNGTGAPREFYVYAELPRIDDEEKRSEIECELFDVFQQVCAVVEDHGRMVKALRRHTADVEFAASMIEGGSERAKKLMSFLSWLADDNFIFMGYRRYNVRREDENWWVQLAPKSGLGLMRASGVSRFEESLQGDEIPELVRSRLEAEELVFFDKSRLESRIHREGRLDSISVKLLDEDGRVSGFGRIIGLLTHKAVRTRGSSIPLLSGRRDQVLERIGLEPGSHRYKAAVDAFDSLPIEFLFPFDRDDIARVVQNVLSSMDDEDVTISVVPDRLNRSFFVSASMPREIYREELRNDVRSLLRTKYSVNYTDDRSSFIDDVSALIHFFCTSLEDFEPGALDQLERDVKSCITRWEDRFESALLETHVPEEAARLLATYGAAFPEEYRVATPAADAIADVEHMERLARDQVAVELAFGVDWTAAGQETRLKLYQHERPYLTDLLPVLDAFGLQVIDATLTRLDGGDELTRWIVTFRIEPLAPRGPELRESEERVIEGLQQVLTGNAEGDALNRLILSAGLSWRDVDLLRAYLGYVEQISGNLKRSMATDTLSGHPEATRGLLEYFRARFDPDCSDRSVEEGRAFDRIQIARRAIPTAHEDHVFAVFSNLMRSTTRTNFFAREHGDEHVIVLKLDPSTIADMPEPRPFAEIWVHAAEMAGVHLRGGRIARGGIRWSDRVHDFRTEILGLVKTQMVKNGVIVPVGSKGGFVLKRTFADPARTRAEADRQYGRFIESLLSLTDDVKDGAVVPPRRVVRHDGDDTYLVVAADKGTAHLSDTANEVSRRRGYWLGDAFASGGSDGYDHKIEAITARGAWVCVRRHFTGLGLDVEQQSFSCAGIGDMSGDVFGNGLLLMDQARLLAAFNHEHVFLDPNPDPRDAIAERRRLFELPRSTWKDYDDARISKGGGVWERNARSIPLSPETRMALDVEDEELSGEQLVRAILRMPIDLLWNGGIGTYVKSSRESNRDVGDRDNDAVRIDARELRARVIGEGGNLGLTQRARVEFAIAGGRIHTDAVDNSAGVDLSDHEVNFKILLSAAEHAGTISRADRNRELRECVDQAVASVLANNGSQSGCLAADVERGKRDAARIQQAADFLVRRAGLDAEIESLPEPEQLRTRVSRSDEPVGYTRPELSVLLGYTKLLVKRELHHSPVPEHPAFRNVLASYFPETLRERFPAEIDGHPLAREITATCLTNRVIDQAGVTLVPELVRGLGVSVADVISAYWGADRLLEADHLFWEIEEQQAAAPVKLEAALRVESCVRDATRALLGLEHRSRFEPEELSTWIGLVRGLRDVIGRGVRDEEVARVTARATRLADSGLKPGLCIAIESLPLAVRALGVLGIAMRSGASLPRAVNVHTAVGEATRISWLLDRLNDPDRRQESWDRVAAECIYLEMLDAQRTLTARVLEAGDGADPRKLVEKDFARQLPQIAETVAHVEADQTRGLAPLVVLSQQIRRLC